jgi:hypothetical protein
MPVVVCGCETWCLTLTEEHGLRVFEEFKNNIILAMNETINWFQSNLLTLNCNKNHFLQFLTKKTK